MDLPSTPTANAHARPPDRPAASGSSAYMQVMLASGASKAVLDIVRSAIKLPEAAAAGRFLPALAMTLTSSPTTALIDPRAPAVATAASQGRSFTKLDAGFYRAAAFIGVGVGAFQAVSGVRNIVDAVRSGGGSALYDTRQGRDGVLQAASGAISLGTFGRAAGAARAAGVTGIGGIAVAAATSPMLASPVVIGATLASGVLVFANGKGFLDFMNRGETRGAGQVVSDSWREMDLKGKVHRARRRFGV